MRGLIAGVLTLTMLDLVLRVPPRAFSGALATPTGWLRRWMDPGVPLISRPVPAGTATAAGLDAGNPAAAHVNQLGESTAGACPPGFPKGVKCLGM